MISQEVLNQKRAAKREADAPVAVYRCTDRATSEQFYAVPSSNPKRQPYKVTWNAERLKWDCPCGDPHNQCKHVRAVSEVCNARAVLARRSA